MNREFSVITDPNNLKAVVYQNLGYRVLDDGLHIIAGAAEGEYDRILNIGFRAPLYPRGGRGYPYPVDVALEKALAAVEHVDDKGFMTTDTCWTEGETVLNKPRNDQERLREALAWWMGMRGSRVGNIGGSALCNTAKREVELIFTELHFGIVNPRADSSDFLTIMTRTEAVKFSGGISLSRAIECGIILGETIKWQRSSFGTVYIAEIPNIPTDRRLMAVQQEIIGRGELSIDPANKLAIHGLLYCVEP